MRFNRSLLAGAAAALLVPHAAGAQGFLSDGGGISTGYEIGLDPSDGDVLAGGDEGERGEFLEDGGGVSSGFETFTSEREEFLEDGGSVSADVSAFTPEREEFLEDGGGITDTPGALPVPRTRYSDTGTRLREARAGSGQRLSRDGSVRFSVGPAQRGWRSVTTPRAVVASASGSFVSLATEGAASPGSGRDERIAEARAGVHANPGPRLIDVQTERLDRRPYPKSGVDVIITGGGSKIIRIAPGT
ncbi:hypothetical protein U0C82_05830 [Fulvimarina sp. 2208YS6-2-32]|uniref:Uncharacterized protein n=1 Tax=Fulvimarina uroteuthidis TaxID=3098149 RepID=A0ABU5I0M1_9HYPH|nr:hypothetical protein [Fulvimarina sp. 2208YS6-2-32]MDY8108672.1 hypothetical protein [Fulvimarina sp. 2208YS6-2-32]